MARLAPPEKPRRPVPAAPATAKGRPAPVWAPTNAPGAPAADAPEGERWAFTCRDTPEVRQRIEGDLARVLAAVRAVDPHLRSLLLTGGFARGEGTVLGGAPQNDYDFVAVRATSRPARAYPAVAAKLEGELGLHIDLAPIAGWRLPHVAHSIFWYETALRGRVVWGDDVRPRLPVHDVAGIDRAEGLRLLVNRSAGLLLATGMEDPHAKRIQCAKALLAALDAQLLASGRFAPSQRERWALLQQARGDGTEPPGLTPFRSWLDWAFAFKLDPARVPRDADAAWAAARKAILKAVPPALQHAGLPDLDAYAEQDGWIDRAVYWRRSAALPGARRLARHPTARLRVATLRLLADSPDGQVRREAAEEHLRPLARMARSAPEPLHLLDALRKATLQ